MIRNSLWRRSSRSLALLFLAVVVPPAATLVWLGLQLLAEDRSLLASRDLELRQALTQSAVRSLELSVSEAERRLADGPVPEGMVRFAISAQGIEAQLDRVLWLPVSRPLPNAESTEFAEAERLEYQGGHDAAVLIYEQRARSTNPELRAGALLRLARVHQSLKHWEQALGAYRRLTTIGEVSIEGAPADLQARRAICDILHDSGRADDLRREARRLQTDLLAGRWMLDQPTWVNTSKDMARWTGEPVPAASERRMFSTVADTLWSERSQTGQARRLIVAEDSTVTVLFGKQGDKTTALAVAPSVLRLWTDKAIASGQLAAARLSLVRPDNTLLVGATPTAGTATVKAAGPETGLPWTVILSPGDSSPAATELASGQRLMGAGLVAILIFFAGGSYFLWHLMQREIAVARLQSDFVAAVSHEFRTPLTSLRNVTELLEESDEIPRERRRAFYEALGRNTERLHRLVESLLDFARMESGRKPYDLRPIDPGALVSEVVADFRREVTSRGFTVDLHVDPGPAVRLHGDALSLTNALWNLLENAVKYSPDSRVVHVSVKPSSAGISIAVRDHGLGIPAHERKEIFHRFVRGEKARRLGIKGTGLGLAMVSHIVQAHGGTIEVDSEEGVGSAFTIILPAGKADRSPLRQKVNGDKWHEFS